MCSQLGAVQCNEATGLEYVGIYAIVMAPVLIALIFLNAAGVTDQNNASSELAGRTYHCASLRRKSAAIALSLML